MKPLVFLDMDGVIADYKAAVIKELGNPKREWTYDAWTSYYLSEDEFIEKISYNTDFWREMPLTPAARLIFSELERAKVEIFVLSDPKHCKYWNHKIEWALSNFNVKSTNVILTPYKHLLAMPNRILIDDHKTNVDNWKAYGGLGFHWQYGGDDIAGLNELRIMLNK